ncbi:hypothetical protein DP117_08145 [Brasilonema sp. UFV-L1]|nr:hypothetical protein [Brasilonema sp. UFV-L1]
MSIECWNYSTFSIPPRFESLLQREIEVFLPIQLRESSSVKEKFRIFTLDFFVLFPILIPSIFTKIL